MYHVFRNRGRGPITHGLKSLDRFYDAMLPCPTVVLSVRMNSKYFNPICISPLIELQRGYNPLIAQVSLILVDVLNRIERIGIKSQTGASLLELWISMLWIYLLKSFLLYCFV